MCKLTQRRKECVVGFITNIVLISISLLFALCFYFSETIRDRIVVGMGFIFFVGVSYLLNRLEMWISEVETHRGNYNDEKENVAKMV